MLPSHQSIIYLYITHRIVKSEAFLVLNLLNHMSCTINTISLEQLS